MKLITHILIVCCILGCSQNTRESQSTLPERSIPEPDFVLSDEKTHNKFSRTINPIIKVPSGAVIEFNTKEATDGQLNTNSTVEDLQTLDFEPIHPLTGPVFVEGAHPGNVLAVKLHAIEIGSWGWTAIIPGFGFLSDDFTEPYLKTYKFNKDDKTVKFNEQINLPVKPFAGVLGVAPDTDSLLNTIPPRANGGNMDDPSMVAGTTVYLPVFCRGCVVLHRGCTCNAGPG